MVTPQNSTGITPQQELYIDFVAAGGIDVDHNRVSHEEFAATIKVDRTTLYNWRQSIPDFWDRVAGRSSVLIDRKVPRIINAMYMKALKGDVSAAKLLLSQAGRLKTPRNEEFPGVDSINFSFLD